MSTPPSRFVSLLRSASSLRRQLGEDARAHLERDPAARSVASVALTAPGLHALWMHRVAHVLWERERLLAAELVAYASRHLTGVEIHPAAQLGRRVVIDHGMGVVIGETTVVGDDCTLYQGVVLGGRSLRKTKRHPQLGRGVVVGCNACVLGYLTVGDGARIGACSVVLNDVPAGATTVGAPARQVRAPYAVRGDALEMAVADAPSILRRNAVAAARSIES